MELYVLRIDYYNEWAIDCGACDLVGVYDTKEEACLQLTKMLDNDKKDGYYIENAEATAKELYDWYKQEAGNNFYVDVYENESDYDKGKNNATYVITKKLLNDTGVFV